MGICLSEKKFSDFFSDFGLFGIGLSQKLFYLSKIFILNKDVLNIKKHIVYSEAV